MTGNGGAGSDGLKSVALAAGPIAAGTLYLILGRSEGLSDAGRGVAALAVLMAVWWLTEAIPIPATGLLPIAALPLVTRGEVSVANAAAPYARDLIFLFMGGFMLALAMERWNLHRRVAIRTVLIAGTRPTRMIFGFMVATAFLSMWISNTATTVMMLPIGLSVIDLVRRELAKNKDPSLPAAGEPFPFAIALLLGIAYAASIGGVSTIIGTPPNGLLAAFVRDTYGLEISMQSWLPIGLSFTVVFLPVAWWVLTRWSFPVTIGDIPGGRALIRGELARLGPMSAAERRVLIVFVCTATAWVGRSWLTGLTFAGGVRPFMGLSDAGIAIGAALCLFILRAPGEGENLLDWNQAVKLPWGILILIGGGLSLAAAVSQTGVDRFIGESVAGLQGIPSPVVVVVVGGMVILLTELTSNAATTATFLPIMGAVAEGLGIDPLLLVIPLTMGASCAFMMPVATPPNAIVFGSGEITIAQMCRAGLWLNVIGLVLLVAVVYLVAVPVLGIDLVASP